MTQVEDPRLLLGKSDKPYHITGEVREPDYLERLDSVDRLCLAIILQHAQSVATAMSTALHVLAVGSSADLKALYGDIDLLFCPKDKHVRFKFVQQVYEQLLRDERFTISREFPKGSAPIFNSPYAPFKLFAFPRMTEDLSGPSRSFDMTFLGERWGSFEEALSFHLRNRLAFSRLESLLVK
ncbi:MAG: hypothetical protein WC775_04210 [Patescibacteria group bacterium]